MEYPFTFAEFKTDYPELVLAAQVIGSTTFNAEAKFTMALREYRSMLGENMVINAYGLPASATAEQQEDAKFTNSLALASIFAGYIRQMNVQNEFIPGYDGEDAGNNESDIQGTQNTMFNAIFSQNIYGRKYLNNIYRAGIPVGLAAM